MGRVLAAVLGVACTTHDRAPAAVPEYRGVPAREWVRRLGDHDDSSALVAATALKHIGTPAIPYLLPGLSSADERVRTRTKGALAYLCPADLPALVATRDSLRDSVVRVRLDSAIASARAGVMMRERGGESDPDCQDSALGR